MDSDMEHNEKRVSNEYVNSFLEMLNENNLLHAFIDQLSKKEDVQDTITSSINEVFARDLSDVTSLVETLATSSASKSVLQYVQNHKELVDEAKTYAAKYLDSHQDFVTEILGKVTSELSNLKREEVEPITKRQNEYLTKIISSLAAPLLS